MCFCWCDDERAFALSLMITPLKSRQNVCLTSICTALSNSSFGWHLARSYIYEAVIPTFASLARSLSLWRWPTAMQRKHKYTRYRNVVRTYRCRLAAFSIRYPNGTAISELKYFRVLMPGMFESATSVHFPAWSFHNVASIVYMERLIVEVRILRRDDHVLSCSGSADVDCPNRSLRRLYTVWEWCSLVHINL